MAETPSFVLPEALAENEEPETDQPDNKSPEEINPENPIDSPEVELTQEQRERVKSLREYVKTTREREETRENISYPGVFGKAQRWFEKTGWHKAVGIGGKVVLGAAAAAGATVLTGGAGLALAPILYSLGLKSAIDGGIEAAQYYVGKKSGRSRRLAIEGLKADIHNNVQESYNKIARRVISGELSERQAAVEFNQLAKNIRVREEAVMAAQNKDTTETQKAARVRFMATLALTIGGLLIGIPSGIQDLDKDGVSHAVWLTHHGFGFIQKAGEAISAGSYQYFGATMHELGTQFGMPLLGKIGVGAAITGLMGKLGFDAWRIGGHKMISEQPPEFLQLDPVEPQPEEPTDPNQPKPEPIVPEPVEPIKPAPENPTTPEPIVPTPEPTPAPNTPSLEVPAPTNPETIAPEKSPEFSTFIKEMREKMPKLRAELAEINQKREALDKEWADLERVPYNTAETDQRRMKIEEEHAKLTARANEITAELSKLREFEQLDNHSEKLGQKLSALDQEYDNIDQRGNGTLAEQKRMQQIMAEYEAITRGRSELRRKMLEIFEALTQKPAEEPVIEEVPPTPAAPDNESSTANAPAPEPTPEPEPSSLPEEAQEPENTESGEVDVTSIDSIREFAKKTELESKESYEKSLDRALEALKNVGGIVELRRGVPTVVLPDLHGRREMLLKALEQRNPQGISILDQLKDGKINLVCLGDGMHTEDANNWIGAAAKYKLNNGRVQYGADNKPIFNALGSLENKLKSALAAQNLDFDTFHVDDIARLPEIKNLYDEYKKTTEKAKQELMRKEMVASMGLMKMIMELKSQYPDSFQYLRGNHDDVMGGFVKYANESADVREWMRNNMGEEFLAKWAEFEKSLPLMATGENLVLSHSAPGIILTREQIENRAEISRDKNNRVNDAFRYLAWTDNTISPYSFGGDAIINPTLNNLGMLNATWIIGHRPVDTNGGLYRTQFNNKLIQINNPNEPVMATIAPDGKFGPNDIEFI